METFYWQDQNTGIRNDFGEEWRCALNREELGIWQAKFLLLDAELSKGTTEGLDWNIFRFPHESRHWLACICRTTNTLQINSNCIEFFVKRFGAMKLKGSQTDMLTLRWCEDADGDDWRCRVDSLEEWHSKLLLLGFNIIDTANPSWTMFSHPDIGDSWAVCLCSSTNTLQVNRYELHLFVDIVSDVLLERGEYDD